MFVRCTLLALAALVAACNGAMVPLDARELQELPEQASKTAKSKQCAAKNFRCGECADDFSFCKECKTITPGDATVSPPVPSVTWTATVRPDIDEEAVTCSPNAKTVTRTWRQEPTGTDPAPPIYVRVGDTVEFVWAPNYVSPTQDGLRRSHNVVQLFTKDGVEDSLRTQDNACKALNGVSTDQFPLLKEESLVYASAEKLFPTGNFASVSSAAPPAAITSFSTPKYTKPGMYEYVCTVGTAGHCNTGMYQQVIVKGGGPAV